MKKHGPQDRPGARYTVYAAVFQVVCLAANITAIAFLAVLLFQVGIEGAEHLSFDFLTNYPSRFPAKAGILSAFVGTILMLSLTGFLAVVMGLGAAIYLEEYAGNSWFVRAIKLNIKNLAGVPSIVYGILGLTLFVRGLDLGRSLLAGSMTMALLILPIITIAAQEAIKAVPNSFRLAGFGIGMTRWQVIYYQVLPMAFPGMITGVILALSRAIGESAPLIMIGALTFVAFLPASVLDTFTVLPIQIFNWTTRPQKEFHEIAAAGIIVLLVILLSMNSLAIWMRIHYKRKYRAVYK